MKKKYLCSQTMTAMAKRKIELCDCASEIVRALRPGILITTKAGGKVNSMTIGWGTLGIIWNRPVFIAYVRKRPPTA